MRKPSGPFVLVYLSQDATGGIQCHEVCNTEDEAKERFAELAKQSAGEVLVFGSLPIPVEIEDKPRVTFYAAPKPLAEQAKPKRTRRTKAQMEAARAAEGKAKANGHTEATS